MDSTGFGRRTRKWRERTAIVRSVLWLSAMMLMGAPLMGLSGCGSGEPESADVPQKMIQPKSTGADPTMTQRDSAKDTVASLPTGHLVGVIRYEGAVPELPPLIKMGDAKAKDAEVCAAHEVPDESFIVNPTAQNGIANVFVYLSKAPADGRSRPVSNSIRFDQKGCLYLPHALVVQVGQPVQVLSSDPVAHNVHTVPNRNTSFNQMIQPNNQEGLALVYDRAEREPIEVKCDIHPWMRAWHLPLDHPFAAVTDSRGRFEIRDLPAGTHSLRVWHERPRFVERGYDVVIKSGETTELNLTYSAEQFQPAH